MSNLVPWYLSSALKVFGHLPLLTEPLLCFVHAGTRPGNPPLLSPVPDRLSYQLLKPTQFLVIGHKNCSKIKQFHTNIPSPATLLGTSVQLT